MMTYEEQLAMAEIYLDRAEDLDGSARIQALMQARDYLLDADRTNRAREIERMIRRETIRRTFR